MDAIIVAGARFRVIYIRHTALPTLHPAHSRVSSPFCFCGSAVALAFWQKRLASVKEEEIRKREEADKKNALKVSHSFSKKHVASALAKITKAAAR